MNGPPAYEPGELESQELPPTIPAKRTRKKPQLNGHIDGPALWKTMELTITTKGWPWPNARNVVAALRALPEFSEEAIWKDDFRNRVMTTWKCNGVCPREWTDEDDAVLLQHLQHNLAWDALSETALRQGLSVFLQERSRHPLREYLEGLEWDQTDRLSSFLVDLYGVDQTDYHAAVGRCWLIALVARAMDPGCKVDTMVVIEGAQGLRKSTSLEVLGGEFYAALPRDFGSVDFIQSMDGAWLAEIPDMSGFRGRDLEQIKAFVTIRHDRLRRSYGRRAATWPRQTVFAATANGSDWNEDDTGARRFWPIAAKAVNIDYLRGARDQLFAEAMVRYRRGEAWWDVPHATATEQQEARRIVDPWEPLILQWLAGRSEVRSGQIMEGLLELEHKEINKGVEMRVGKVLRMAGYTREVRRDPHTKDPIRVWKKTDPQRFETDDSQMSTGPKAVTDGLFGTSEDIPF